MYPMLYFTSFYSSIYYYFFICSFLLIYLFDKIPESFEQLEQVLNVNMRTYSSFLNIILVNLEKKKTFWSFNLVNLSGEKSSMLLYISIYKFSLFVCLSVCLYPINVKTAEPIGPKFLWDITFPQVRFMNDENKKKLF